MLLIRAVRSECEGLDRFDVWHYRFSTPISRLICRILVRMSHRELRNVEFFQLVKVLNDTDATDALRISFAFRAWDVLPITYLENVYEDEYFWII